MTPKMFVRATHIIAIGAIILLMYWLFAFILIEAFDLRVFQRNLHQLLFLSVMGIIALMAAALMLNIMLNLTRIADRGSDTVKIKYVDKMIYLILIGFLILAGVLFGGHYYTVQRKQQLLVQSAISLVSEHSKQTQNLAAYRFDRDYVQKSADILSVWEGKDSTFSYVGVIVPDEINEQPVWLMFDQNDRPHTVLKDNEFNKINYLYRTDLPTRQYLQAAFEGGSENIRFVERNGRYELFYPYHVNGKVLVVFRFSDYQPYGKAGS